MTMTATRSAHDPKRASTPRFNNIERRGSRPRPDGRFFSPKQHQRFERGSRGENIPTRRNNTQTIRQHINGRHRRNGKNWHEWGSAASRDRRKEIINPRLRTAMGQTGKGDHPEAGATRDRREGAGSRESPEQVCRLTFSSLHRPRPFGHTEMDRGSRQTEKKTDSPCSPVFLFHTIHLYDLPLHCS